MPDELIKRQTGLSKVFGSYWGIVVPTGTTFYPFCKTDPGPISIVFPATTNGNQFIL